MTSSIYRKTPQTWRSICQGHFFCILVTKVDSQSGLCNHAVCERSDIKLSSDIFILISTILTEMDFTEGAYTQLTIPVNSEG